MTDEGESAAVPGSSSGDGSGLEQKAAKGAAWIALEMMSVQGMSLVVFATLAHFLTSRDFGLIGICFVVLQSAKTILIDQISSAVTRKASPTSLEFSTVFWITVALGLLGFLGIEAVSLVSDQLFHAPGLRSVLQAMGLIFLAMAAGRTQEAWLIRHFHFRVLALRSISGSLVGGLAGIACAILHFGVWSLVVQQITTNGCSFILLWSTCPWRPALVFSRRAASEIAVFLRSIAGNVMLTIVNQNFDTFAIALCFGPSSVGIYTIGKRLKLAVQMVASTPISGVVMPAMAEAGSGARMRDIVVNATAAAFAICGPVFVGAAAVSHDAIRLFFGPHWIAASPVFAWLAIGGLFSLVVDYNNVAFTVMNKVIWTTYLSLIYTVLAIVAFAVSTQLHASAIALPFVVPFAVVLPVSVVLLARITELPFSRWAKAALPPAIVCGIMFVAVRWAATMMGGSSAPVRLASLCLLGGVIYVGLIGIFAPALLRSAAGLVGQRRIFAILRLRPLRRA
jgi:PST family polysaccharide transporter